MVQEFVEMGFRRVTLGGVDGPIRRLRVDQIVESLGFLQRIGGITCATFQVAPDVSIWIGRWEFFFIDIQCVNWDQNQFYSVE